MIELNGNNEEMISISKAEYKELIETAVRCKVVFELCKKEEYISLETLLNILGGGANENKA